MVHKSSFSDSFRQIFAVANIENLSRCHCKHSEECSHYKKFFRHSALRNNDSLKK